MIRIYLDCLGLFHQFRKSLSYCSVGGGTICRLSVPALLGGGGIICLVNVVHGLEGDKPVKWLVGQSLYPIAAIDVLGPLSDPDNGHSYTETFQF